METIAAAVIGALAALGGVWFEKLSEAKAEDRKWAREDTARRRVRGEEAAFEARSSLRQAAALFEAAWEESGYRATRWESPPDDALRELTDRAEDLAIDIPDEAIRAFVQKATSALTHTDDANQGGTDPPWVLARGVAAEVDAVIGAYRRGTPIPPAPETEAAVKAAGEWWAETARLEDGYRERERGAREG